MELFNKFVWSIIEPDNTNDIWFNGKTFNIYKEGKWKPFTISVEQAEEFFKNVENTFKLYQKKLTPGRGITLEDDVISTTQLFQVVKTLPDKGEYNTIYLVLKNIPEDGDYFYEFIWVDNKWEKLGEFKQNINLEDYYTKEDIDSKNYISHTEVDEKLETKVSVEEGKGLSTNDYTDEDKEKLTTIKSKVLNIGNTTQEEVYNWKWLFDQPDCHEYCGRINLAGYNVGFYHNFKKSQNTDAYQIYVNTTDGYLYTGVLTKASIVLNQRIYFTQHYYQPTLKSGVNIATINKHNLLTSENISIYSDWDANSNSSNYIYNKPFYADWSLEKDLSSFVYDNTWQLIDSSSNIGSTTYIKYTWGNITKYVAIPYGDSNEYALNYGPSVWVKRDHDGFGIFLRSPNKHDFTIKIATSINKLSDIFLPNTAALKSDLTTKQDTIEDLSTIRENASKGATALQSVPSEYINETELQQQLSTKADIDGDYPDMSVGLAEDLGGRPFTNDAEFSFRATADKENSIKDGLANIKTLKGNSVVWNQTFKKGAIRNDAGATQYFDEATGEMVIDGTITNGTQYSGSKAYGGEYATLIKGNRYLTIIRITSGEYQGSTSRLSYNGAIMYLSSMRESVAFSTYNGDIDYSVITFNVGDIFDNLRYSILSYNLTKMFGEGNEPMTIEEFYSRCPIGVDMNAYNEGEVIHMTAEGIKSVGDNAWDEEWEEGTIDNITGAVISSNSHIRSKNYTKVISGETYYMLGNFTVIYYDENYNQVDWWSVGVSRELTIPNNVQYLKLYANGITYNNDIMISLMHSGWKQDTNAGYQPYWEDNLMFDQRIKDEFPDGMKKWDKVYNKDGKGYIVKGTGVVDLGKLDWERNPDGFYLSRNLATPASTRWGTSSLPNVMCAKYDVARWLDITESNHNMACSAYDSQVRISDSTYTDTASFKAAMAGVPLYYELAEPTIIEYDEPFNFDYKVADFGTEQAIGSTPSAPISAEIEYDFGANDTIRTNKLAINELREKIKEVAIEDIDTIREGAAKGMTAIQEHQDISHLATKEELNAISSSGMNYVELNEPTVPLAAVNTCYYMMPLNIESTFTVSAFETPTTPVAHYKFMFWGPSSLTLPSGVYWLNGETPELDPACLHELDIVATEVLAEGNYVYKAVLAKFNTVS